MKIGEKIRVRERKRDNSLYIVLLDLTREENTCIYKIQEANQRDEKKKKDRLQSIIYKSQMHL